MLSSDKKVAESNTIQTHFNSFIQDSETACGTVKGSGDDVEVTYYVDQDGQYYPLSGDSKNCVSLPIEADEENPEIPHETQKLVDGEGHQTVTVAPSECGSGDLSSVLVVQENTKPNMNSDIKVGAKKCSDIYKSEDVQVDEPAKDVSDNVVELIKPKVSRAAAKQKHIQPKLLCNFCSYHTHMQYLLIKHMKSHSPESPHKCIICERSFKTRLSVERHLALHNGIKSHKCQYCDNCFTTSGELVRHVRYRHTHEKPHKCSECDYAAVELSKLRRHSRCHSGERPYQCPHCTYASQDSFKLKRHIRTHTGEKPYKCDSCNRSFSQSNTLKSHQLVHNAAQKPVFKCELCPTTCSRKPDLRNHIQHVHTSNVPLKCKRCGETFPDQYSRRMHYRTHVGEKCFKCELCPYATVESRLLRSHMTRHTDAKPFVCDQCKQCFRRKPRLQQHRNLCHNPNYKPRPPKEKIHMCHECERTFANKGNLIRHVAVHRADSGHQDKALKQGRQKKTKFVDANDNDSDDAEELFNLSGNQIEDGQLLSVGDKDGEDYVVLEVIRTGDDDTHVSIPEYIEGNKGGEEEQDKKLMYEDVKRNDLQSKSKLETNVDTCFGFDEEPSEDDGDMTYDE